MKTSLKLATLALFAACQSAPETPEAPPEMSPDQMFAMLEELATPGEQHAFLGMTIGTFDAELDIYMAPGAPPESASGTMVNSWIMDGRYVRGDYDGEFMGRPFQGISMSGFDNATQTFQGTWMDTMSTGMMPTSAGVRDGSKITFERTMYDPMMEQWVDQREVLTIESQDFHKLEMFNVTDGEEMKTMEIRYRRKK